MKNSQRSIRLSLILLGGVILTHYGWLLLRGWDSLELRTENRQLKNEVLRIRELKRDLTALKELNQGLRSNLEMGSSASTSQQPLTVPEVSGSGLHGGAPWGNPVNGRLTRGYLEAAWPGAASHPGIDLATDRLEPVVATSGGRVLFSGLTQRWGWLLILQHEQEWTSWYGHLQQPLVHLGENVSRGQLIARVAEGNEETGAHLHYALQHRGQFVDPAVTLEQVTTTE